MIKYGLYLKAAKMQNHKISFDDERRRSTAASNWFLQSLHGSSMSSLTSGYQRSKQISTISTKSKIAMPKTMQRARTKKNLQIFLIVKRSLGLCKASNFLTVSSTLIWNGFVSFLWCSMFSKYFWFENWLLSLSNWESKCRKKKPGKFKFDTWQLLTFI